ncbi:MAG: Rid family hydrolase, partial [Actinomycetota bacterium]
MSKPVGPYTPIVRAGEWLVSSGQIGIADGALVDGGFDAQFRQAMTNLQGLFE